MASARMSTPKIVISRSPLALSMRISVDAPGQPVAVRTSFSGRSDMRSDDPAVDLEDLGELAADVDARA